MLHHVSLEVPVAEGERSVEFWRALSFAEVEAPGPVSEWVRWLEREGTQVHLILTEEPTVPAIGHAAVVAGELERTIERLEAGGFEVERARDLWGEARAFATAPGGHRVELMAAPPPSAGGRG